MDVGVCLPTAVPDLRHGRVVEWAQRAESLGFASLAVADRLASNRYECLTSLAAAAAVTNRVRLLTTILISPLLPNAVYLAKQAATIDHLSSGRLSLGLAVGGREQDYALSGLDFHHRGRDLDRQIEVMRAVWRGEHGVGPATARPEGPDILIGGGSPASLQRAARNSGWIAGGGAGTEGFRRGADEIREAWQKAGRAGQPRFVAVGLYGLGPNAKDEAMRLLTSSYGRERAEVMLPDVPLTADAVREFVSSFAEAGCDEVILTAASQDLEQLDLFAEAIALDKS